jgi:hypothetical protein
MQIVVKVSMFGAISLDLRAGVTEGDLGRTGRVGYQLASWTKPAYAAH